MAVNWSEVESTVRGAEEYGIVGVSVSGADGARWSHHGDRKFRAASTVKIPLMIEIFRQIDRGERSLNDSHVLRDDQKARGSGVLLHLHDGIELTLNDLIYLMISISDNTATNILIGFAGMEAVNATIRELGMTGSSLAREMKGRPAVPGEQENWATPDDYVRVVEAILDREAASAASCEAMEEMLTTQQNLRRIGRHVPEGTRWGSKTGSIAGVVNDAGFVQTDRGRVAIAIFCEGFNDPNVAEQVIGDISLAAMRACGMVEPGS